jgi:hypothetical protein
MAHWLNRLGRNLHRPITTNSALPINENGTILRERKQQNPRGILPVFGWFRPDRRSMLDGLRQRERAA